MRNDEGSTKQRDQAYRSFTRHLLASDIRPGQFVSQRELVALTQMPLGAIRELVPRLEAEGLITTIPQRGMQIAPIDFSLVRDAYQFRLILEKEAVRHFTATASDEAIAAIRDSHEAILKRVETEGTTADIVGDAQSVDWGFHDILIESLGNEIVTNTYRVNSLKIRLIRQELIRIDGHVVPVMHEHLGIIAEIEKRHADAAAVALERHIIGARQRALGMP
ncbi:GntR family transcriptional regulator [Mesorhizobium sp. RMAD-H1]|uniref:GntR family transcriptional regulator n=1 Tax=Mesorhizobium sp. RMAD-H1 TaxID=2587065 RepID=UPI001620539E|nr:GntR family transcriptional regulator [Mesorhizobium sp. RMAD-H1]MBB2973040.1 DNA-binding GntR family transcriptional regulator [Mesorhizobium sp. RMAD-H1]